MIQRVIYGLVFAAAVFAAVVFMPSGIIAVMLAILSFWCILEFYRLLGLAKIPSFRWFGVGGGVILMLATYLGFKWHNGDDVANIARAAEWEAAVLAFAVLVLMVRQFPQKHNRQPLATIACTLLGIAYIPLMLNFFIKLAFAWSNVGWWMPLGGQSGGYLILFLLIVTKMSDVGAFLIGNLFGQHKLFPRLSPMKTWEGLVGAVLAGIATSCIFTRVIDGQFGTVQISMLHATILGAILAFVGITGDLAESLIKRTAGAKDSGRFIPGLGGILDIADSVLFTLPVMYAYVRVVLHPGIAA